MINKMGCLSSKNNRYEFSDDGNIIIGSDGHIYDLRNRVEIENGSKYFTKYIIESEHHPF